MTAIPLTLSRPSYSRSAEQMREIAEIAGPELELASAEDIVSWAVSTFGSRFCVTSSMADAVLAHVASRVAPGIDVVFLDTGYHFPETIGTRDAVDATMQVNATRTCAAHCAKSLRCRTPWPATTPGPPGCVGRRPGPG
jgi:3'-phosphoadenosine 5'-phosphosulfate sulfotransferase (PAPS reductase)/FAD synthetase